jgi:hypothetical protein
MSWLVAQWYRVRKQQSVEEGLTGIKADIRAMRSPLLQVVRRNPNPLMRGDAEFIQVVFECAIDEHVYRNNLHVTAESRDMERPGTWVTD